MNRTYELENTVFEAQDMLRPRPSDVEGCAARRSTELVGAELCLCPYKRRYEAKAEPAA